RRDRRRVRRGQRAARAPGGSHHHRTAAQRSPERSDLGPPDRRHRPRPGLARPARTRRLDRSARAGPGLSARPTTVHPQPTPPHYSGRSTSMTVLTTTPRTLAEVSSSPGGPIATVTIPGEPD